VPSFKNACFLSYRHGQRQIKQRFITEFRDALASELELLRDEGLYVDLGRLNGGDFYNEALARALYESVCIVIVYQPNYFDTKHPYCAREYRAMCALETRRLSLLGNLEDRNHSVIIPIVLRGESAIPPEIAARRQYDDFSKFMLLDEELSRHPLYAPKIKQIAEYIDARCQCFEDTEIPFDDADEFRLPDEDETKAWLRELHLPRMKFPGAGET